MSSYMNDYDIDHALRRFDDVDTPNRFRVAVVVNNLADWANDNSDGWAYWPKPLRAAQNAISLIESRTWEENEEQERTDATDAEVTAALRPIKAFLTRQGVAHDEVIPVIGDKCQECDSREYVERIHGVLLCPSCLHDAERSGWTGA